MRVYLGLDDLDALRLFAGDKRLEPLGVAGRFHLREQGLQHGPGVAQYRHVALHVFVELRGVDVDVDDVGLSGILTYVARYPVVEAHAYGDEQVAFVGLDIGGHAAVHAQHALVERVVGRDGRETQQGAAHGNVGLFGQSGQFGFGLGDEHALSGQDKGFAGLVDEAGGLIDFGRLDGRVGVVAADELAGLVVEVGQSRLGIFGKVEHYRAGTSVAGNVEGAGHGPGNLVAAAYLVAPFGDRLGDAHHVGLLEGVGAQQRRTYLPRDDDERRAVHHGIRQASDDVGCRRSRGDHDYARFARYPGISLSGVCGSLFVPYENVFQFVAIVVKYVEYGHDGSARVSEDILCIFCDKRSDERFGSFYLFCCHSCSVEFR